MIVAAIRATRVASALVAMSVLAAGAFGIATADAFPDRPIRMIVPYPAGGPTDILARQVAAQMSDKIGQTVVVDNRGGANGVIGTDVVAKSSPDGYTILMTGIEQHVGNIHMFKSVPYDPIKDFVPITEIDAEPLILVVSPSLPVKSVKELVELAKAKPGTLNFASSSLGSLSHLAGEKLKLMAGIDMVHVPYKGGGPAMLDVLAGNVPIYFSAIPASLPHIQAGKLRALAITSSTRNKDLPDLPTLSETPGLADYEASIKFGIWTVAKTPADRVAALNKALVAGLKAPAFVEFLAKQGGLTPVANSPEEMAARIDAIAKQLPETYKAANITPQ